MRTDATIDTDGAWRMPRLHIVGVEHYISQDLETNSPTDYLPTAVSRRPLDIGI